MAKIKEIKAREILNAKGFSTIEATVILDNGKAGVASCPTGRKLARYENVNLADNKAMNNIKNIIAPELIGKEITNQQEIDKIMIELDGTQAKSQLGANAILSVSMATAKAGAENLNIPLYAYLKRFIKKDNVALKIPIPIFNLINEGRENRSPNFNEFLIIPASSKSYLECLQLGELAREAIKQAIETKYAKILDVYDEGFPVEAQTNIEVFSLMQQAIGNTNAKLGFDLFFGLDSRASTFFKDGKYTIKDNPVALSPNDLIEYYQKLNQKFNLLYLEDPFDQDDWDAWVSIYEKMSKTTIISGSDLISTNPYRLELAVERKAINALVIKPNQIGTVIESLAIAEAAREMGLKLVVSHRSNETNDDFLADFSVAISADYIKIGSIYRGENVTKYNRLLQIENNLKIL